MICSGVERSKKRLADTGLFGMGIIERIERIIEVMRDGLDRIPSRTFLHDTTTKNVLITHDGSFSGIVDVDDFCFGDPRFVASLTLAAICAFG